MEHDPLRDYVADVEARLREARQIIEDLVVHARPSFPKTPFRKALDRAKAFLEM